MQKREEQKFLPQSVDKVLLFKRWMQEKKNK